MFLKMYKTYRTGNILQCNIKSDKINPLTTLIRRNPMYDIFKPIELNKTYQQIEGAIKSGYNFWLDVVADTLKLYKTK